MLVLSRCNFWAPRYWCVLKRKRAWGREVLELWWSFFHTSEKQRHCRNRHCCYWIIPHLKPRLKLCVSEYFIVCAVGLSLRHLLHFIPLLVTYTKENILVISCSVCLPHVWMVLLKAPALLTMLIRESHSITTACTCGSLEYNAFAHKYGHPNALCSKKAAVQWQI